MFQGVPLLWRQSHRMPHRDKTFRVHFTAAQERACTLRRKLSAKVISPERATPELIEILYGEDYTACVVAARTLGEHGDETALMPLIETLLRNDEAHPYFSRQLRCAALEAVARVGHQDEMAKRALHAARWDPDPEVAQRATRASRAYDPCVYVTASVRRTSRRGAHARTNVRSQPRPLACSHPADRPRAMLRD